MRMSSDLQKAGHMAKIVIVAAMEREVKPLIRNWKVTTLEHSGRRFRVFESGDASLICGGVGAAAARRATEAMIAEMKPDLVLSVGFAGALDASLQVGDIIEPRTIINAADGVRTEVAAGAGILVSSATVAGKEQKSRLGKTYGASAVDMEAASVAKGAQARGVEFAALKAISDAADFSLPALDRFVADDGTFSSGSFACHVALRPWLWGTTMALARNSSKASAALCSAITTYLYLDRENSFRPSVPAESLVAQLNLSRSESAFASVRTGTGAEPHTRTQAAQQRKQ